MWYLCCFTSSWGQCGCGREKVGPSLFLFLPFRVQLWSEMSWHGPYGCQLQWLPFQGTICVHLVRFGDTFSPILWWAATLLLVHLSSHSPEMQRQTFLFQAVGDILRATVVLLCMCALLLSHILLANQFFCSAITAGESLPLLWLAGNECVCAVSISSG